VQLLHAQGCALETELFDQAGGRGHLGMCALLLLKSAPETRTLAAEQPTTATAAHYAGYTSMGVLGMLILYTCQLHWAAV
jgi:hypothetical protein